MMFQNFEVLSSPGQAADRVARLRAGFAASGVTAVAVPRSDEYLGEYVPACAERLAWLTGYTGSAGLVLVLEDKAHVFVDGRYTNQVRAQTDPAVFAYQNSVTTPLAAFLEASSLTGLRLGIDPWTWPSSEVTRLQAALETLEGELVLLDHNHRLGRRLAPFLEEFAELGQLGLACFQCGLRLRLRARTKGSRLRRSCRSVRSGS